MTASRYLSYAALWTPLFVLFSAIHAVSAASTPLTPDTSTLHEKIGTEGASTTTASLLPIAPKARVTPKRLIIPSIGLNASVQHLGVNEKGEMDVPDGATRDVGWYRHGTSPGERGSAVIDAHVYAAFKKLHLVPIGADIFVEMSNGSRTRFRAAEAIVYKLDEVPRDTLFNRADDERLNLITCAGRFDRTRKTYDHRLIVYAELVEEGH